MSINKNIPYTVKSHTEIFAELQRRIAANVPHSEVFDGIDIDPTELLNTLFHTRERMEYSIRNFTPYGCNYVAYLRFRYSLDPLKTRESDYVLPVAWSTNTFTSIVRKIIIRILFVYDCDFFNPQKKLEECRNFKEILRQREKARNKAILNFKNKE